MRPDRIATHALAATLILLWGCSDRVIESGQYTCNDDSNCEWGWRCLPIQGGDKACVNTSGSQDGGAPQAEADQVVALELLAAG